MRSVGTLRSMSRTRPIAFRKIISRRRRCNESGVGETFLAPRQKSHHPSSGFVIGACLQNLHTCRRVAAIALSILLTYISFLYASFTALIAICEVMFTRLFFFSKLEIPSVTYRTQGQCQGRRRWYVRFVIR